MGRANTDGDDSLSLSEQEKDLIKRQFMRHFGGSRSIHDGVLLRRWATGERKGQVKVPMYVQAMVDRGLLTVADDGGPWASARFTDKGFAALRHTVERALAAGRRICTATSSPRCVGWRPRRRERPPFLRPLLRQRAV